MTSKERHLLRTYGITLKQYNQLRRKQKYCCAVCKKHESEFEKSLHVDHDHKTGEIFGLLCFRCNKYVIGNIRDPNLYKNAYNFLKKGTGWFVPRKEKSTRRRRKRRRN